MKKIVYHFVLLSILIVSTASSCNKPEDEPVIVPTGENTMYYYIDGDLYIPETVNNGGIVSYAINYFLCLDNETFNLRTPNLLLQFFHGIEQTGITTLNQGDFDSCQVGNSHGYYKGPKELNDNGVLQSIAYYTHDGSGTVNITYLSEDKQKFKGTFDMSVYHENTDVEVKITGHFNINLDTLNN